MPFGTIGRTGPGMRQVVGFGDRSSGRGTFGAHLRRAIVTNGDFTGSQPSELRFRVVRAVGRGITVLDGVHVVQGEGGDFGGVCFPFSRWEMPLRRRQ